MSEPYNPPYNPFEPEEAPAAPATRRKRGPAPKAPESQRKHRIAVYLNAAELKVINGFSELSGVCPAAYFRGAALNSPPVVIPQLNQEVWQMLGKAAANLNQIAKSINTNDVPDLYVIRQALAQFRTALVSQK